jgi:tetratricopeptide (TPR) repeat protein
MSSERTASANASPQPPLAELRQRALALFKTGQKREALEACRHALAQAPQQPDMLALAGIIATELGEVEEGVAFYQRAIALKPDAAELHYNLGNALRRLERNEEAVAAYRGAATCRPDLVPAYNNLGSALQALGLWDEAADAFRRALTLAPGAAELHRNLGIVLESTGRRQEAIGCYRRALALAPDISAYRNLATTLLEEGEPRATAETCDAWLKAVALRPERGAVEALSLKAVALDELGDRAGARSLVDMDRFLRVIEVTAPPPGYDSLKAFNVALTEQLMRDPTLAVPTTRDPHYNGPQFRTTGELFDEPTGAMTALEGLVRREVDAYLAKVARRDAGHPYLANPPERWKPIAQATVLDSLGALAPHVHYSGYVSGVYYVQIPEAIGGATDGQAGWLEVGRLPQRFHRVGRPEIRAFKPRENVMILFPSYFYHNTVPFDSAAPRISIAFDATPLPAA